MTNRTCILEFIKCDIRESTNPGVNQNYYIATKAIPTYLAMPLGEELHICLTYIYFGDRKRGLVEYFWGLYDSKERENDI